MLLNSSEEKKQLFVPLLGVQEEFIRLTIRSIKEAYTSYDEFFLREYKLDQEKRNRLAELYCE
jgi:protein-tyrosine phosphatase